MSEFFDILSHKGRAKAAMKKMNIEQLESLKELVGERLEEAKREEHEAMKAESRREELLQKIYELAAEGNISLEGIGVPIVKKRKVVTLTDDKYQIMDIHGFQRSWSGFGHAPVQFKQAYSEGFGKDDMLKGKHAMLRVAFTDTTKCVQIKPEPDEAPQQKVKSKKS
jgi:DNA-binding protein H-NS